jgi:hypothetical protein
MTVRTQARKAKKRRGPRLKRAIGHTLEHGVCHRAVLPTRVHYCGQAQSGCLRIHHGTYGKDITVDMSAGGVDKHVSGPPEPQYPQLTTHACYRYKHRTTAVTIIAQPTIASKSRTDVSSLSIIPDSAIS